MKLWIGCAVWVMMICFAAPASSQLLNKLKKKAESAVENEANKAISGDQSKNANNNSSGNNSNNNNNGSNNTNSGGLSQNQGGGLTSTPPDVKQNLTDGETAYKSGKYGEARYAIQQAMLGVELEIGNKILKSLPEAISGLAKDASADQVTSTGYGWAGLTIVRKYLNNNGKEFRVTVANSAMMMAGVNAYLNSGYAQTNGGQQNWKQTKFKGNRAIIEFDQNTGYKLSVPLGQSSMVMFEAVSFATENEVMSAANAVDVDTIKKMLGEQ
jgi:hypothetical protein